MSYDANVLRRATQRLEEERRARSDRAVPRKRKLKKPQKQKGPADRCGPQGLFPLCSVAGLP